VLKRFVKKAVFKSKYAIKVWTDRSVGSLTDNVVWLIELYLATSQGIKASQQAQKNTPILEAIDQAFQTRLMGPLLHE
jgi:hypothetical protein